MGSAQIQGDLWGTHVQDWADLQEGTARPVYDEVFNRLGLGPTSIFLDVGCGTGLAAQLAAKRGARVAGLDASMASIAIARARVPGGTFNVGEMEELPFGDASVNVVTSFNAFQYAASPVKALREAFRVLQPGGQVAMVTWGQAHQCEHAATLAAVGACLPPPPPGAGGPFALSEPGRIEELMRNAGLSPRESGEVACPFAYPDEDTALRAICSAGPVVRAVRHAGKARVHEAVRASLAPYRTAEGGYRQQNIFRFVIAAD